MYNLKRMDAVSWTRQSASLPLAAPEVLGGPAWRPCDDQPPGSWPQATQLCHPNLGSPAGDDSKQSISYGALAPRRQLAGPVGSDAPQ